MQSRSKSFLEVPSTSYQPLEPLSPIPGSPNVFGNSNSDQDLELEDNECILVIPPFIGHASFLSDLEGHSSVNPPRTNGDASDTAQESQLSDSADAKDLENASVLPMSSAMPTPQSSPKERKLSRSRSLVGKVGPPSSPYPNGYSTSCITTGILVLCFDTVSI